MTMLSENDTPDTVVQEVRKIKETLSEKHDYDIDRILEDAQRKQGESGRTILAPRIRPS
jgi:hypothetical protein